MLIFSIKKVYGRKSNFWTFLRNSWETFTVPQKCSKITLTSMNLFNRKVATTDHNLLMLRLNNLCFISSCRLLPLYKFELPYYQGKTKLISWSMDANDPIWSKNNKKILQNFDQLASFFNLLFSALWKK